MGRQKKAGVFYHQQQQPAFRLEESMARLGEYLLGRWLSDVYSQTSIWLNGCLSVLKQSDAIQHLLPQD